MVRKGYAMIAMHRAQHIQDMLVEGVGSNSGNAMQRVIIELSEEEAAILEKFAYRCHAVNQPISVVSIDETNVDIDDSGFSVYPLPL